MSGRELHPATFLNWSTGRPIPTRFHHSRQTEYHIQVERGINFSPQRRRFRVFADYASSDGPHRLRGHSKDVWHQ